jgi:ankyrin repeat protein
MEQRHKERSQKPKLRERTRQVLASAARSIKRAFAGRRLDNAFFRAVRNGDNAEIRRLIKAGADIAAKGDFGWTALHYAANNGHVQTCALLTREYAKAGGDIKELIAITDAFGWTALRRATKWRYAQIAQLFKSMPLLQGWVGKETFSSFMESFGECVS